MKALVALVEEQAAELSETRQQQTQTANELHETREMVKQMQLQIMSLMKNKGLDRPPGGDPADDDDDHNAAV